MHESPLGFLVLTRYEECTSLLRDPKSSSDDAKSPMFRELVDSGTSDMLGVPREDDARFRDWSHALARSLDPEFLLPPDAVAAREKAIDEFEDYFLELYADRRKHSRDDMLTRLVEARRRGTSPARAS